MTWTRFTQDNLAQAQRELRASAELQLLSERVLQETCEDLRAQCAAVDAAFARRCQEVSEAKVSMELHLTQVWGGGQHHQQAPPRPQRTPGPADGR